MSFLRALAVVGVAYWVVRKITSRSVPASELEWDDAHVSSVARDDGRRRVERPDKPATESQPFGDNGSFGSHAPYGDGPKVH